MFWSSKKRYYLISYAHAKGFGNCFFVSTNGRITIRNAEKELKNKYKIKDPTVVTINKIHKSQYEEAV